MHWRAAAFDLHWGRSPSLRAGRVAGHVAGHAACGPQAEAVHGVRSRFAVADHGSPCAITVRLLLSRVAVAGHGVRSRFAVTGHGSPCAVTILHGWSWFAVAAVTVVKTDTWL